MKGKIAVIMIGAVLATTSAMLPASATVSNTCGQHLTEGQQQTHHTPKPETGTRTPAKSTPSTRHQSLNHQHKWRLDKKGAKFNHLSVTEHKKFDTFQNAVHKGLSPKEAAEKVGDSKYTKLKGTKDQFEIRLSEKTRVTFRVDGHNRVVKILEVGGHT